MTEPKEFRQQAETGISPSDSKSGGGTPTPNEACGFCSNGLVWDPRVQGNVTECLYCDGTGEVQ